MVFIPINNSQPREVNGSVGSANVWQSRRPAFRLDRASSRKEEIVVGKLVVYAEQSRACCRPSALPVRRQSGSSGYTAPVDPIDGAHSLAVDRGPKPDLLDGTNGYLPPCGRPPRLCGDPNNRVVVFARRDNGGIFRFGVLGG